MKIIEFNNIKYEVSYFKYYNGRSGILLTEVGNNSNTINCTLNIFGAVIVENQVVIKNWNENVGLYRTLVDNNIILPYSRTTQIGMNKGLVCNMVKV